LLRIPFWDVLSKSLFLRKNPYNHLIVRVL
jgi:hypothetical protein